MLRQTWSSESRPNHLRKATSSFFVFGISHHLIDSGAPFLHDSPAVFSQAAHALGHGNLAEIMRGLAAQNESANFVAYDHHLKDSLPATKTRAGAVAASGASKKRWRHQIAIF